MAKRAGQTFIGFKCDAEFRARLVAASGGALSQFVRDAIIAKLRAMRIPVDASLAEPPSRLGKCGPRKIVQIHSGSGNNHYHGTARADKLRK